MLRRYLPSLLVFLTAPLATAADFEECPLEDYQRLEQQFVLSVFGSKPAQFFASNPSDQKLLQDISKEDIQACTDDIPQLSNQVVGVFSQAMISIGVIIASTAIASIFLNLGAGAMSETQQDERTRKLRQSVFVLIVLLMATPIGVLTGSGLSSLSSSYSALNLAMFKMMGSASIAADKIDQRFTMNTQSSIPFYLPPDPNYLTTTLNETDEVGYSVNSMSHILRFSSCLLTELPQEELGSVVSKIQFRQTDTRHEASFGNTGNACSLSVSMPKNTYTPKQIKEAKLNVSESLWLDQEVQLFANAVREAVQSAIDFKIAQFAALDGSFSIKSGDKLPVVPSDWHQSCPTNFAEISGSVGGQRSEIGELVAEERKAELCLSKQLVSRFYSPKYSFNGTRTEFQPKCSVDNLKACAEELCRFDPAASKTGIFDCAVVVDAIAQNKHVEKVQELGWIAKPLDLMTLVERNAPPVEPQRSLAEWRFESRVVMTEAGVLDFGNRDTYGRYRESIYDTEVGTKTPVELLAQGRVDKQVNHDLFSLMRVDTCLNYPNQSLVDNSGQVIGVCGTPIQTLRSLGDSMMNFYMALQAGNHLQPVMSKLYSKQKDKKKAKQGDGKIEGVDTNGSTNSKAIAAVSAAVGGGLYAYLPEIKAAVADKPFSAPSGAIFSALAGVSAFTAGAVLTDGVISLSHMILFAGFSLKYLLPLLLVAPFYAGILWVIMSGLVLLSSAILLVIQPLVAPKELARKYTALMLKAVSLVVTFVSLILMYYLSIILSEQLLPAVLGGVSQLAGHINNLSGTITSIVFGVVIYSLLYVCFISVLVSKLLDVYKQAREFNKTLFQDGTKQQSSGEQTIAATKQKTDFAKSLTKKN